MDDNESDKDANECDSRISLKVIMSRKHKSVILSCSHSSVIEDHLTGPHHQRCYKNDSNKKDKEI